MEFIIGGYALLILAVYGFVEVIFLELNALMGEAGLLHLFGKFILSAALIFPPTAAMGATLPLVIQYFTRSKALFLNNISFFYAINTLGGAFGVLCAGFFIIEFLGIHEGIVSTAMINMAIGFIIFVSIRKGSIAENGSDSAAQKKPAVSPKRPRKHSGQYDKILYLAAAGFAGFAALSYEIIWTRGLKFLIHNTTYSFSIILITFLIGIAAGSGHAKIRKWKISVHFLYGVLQVALGLFAIATIYLFYDFSRSSFFQAFFVEIIYDYAYHWLWGIAVFVVICAIMFLIPAIIMGILFPLINDIFYTHIEAKAGKTVSSIYAINTLFSILGSLVAGFVLLPEFGIKTAILIISVINFALGIIFIWKSAYKRVPAFAISLALLTAAIISTSSGSDYLLGRGERKDDRVLFYKEGAMATVKVFERQRARYMNIDGITIAATSPGLLQKEKLIGHLPFFFNESIQDVLSVGLASGISVGSMSLHASVNKIDCVELIEPVFAAARSFRQYNYDIFSNPKIDLIKNDIYAYLKYTNKKYDLISSDGKLGSLCSGNTIMLAADYFELCKEKLNDDGLFIHWVPIITPTRALKVITDTLKKTFEQVSIFYFYSSDIFMIASNAPITFDHKFMDRVLENDAVRNDIDPFFIKNGLSIVSAFTGFYNESANSETRINTFNKPILEFEYLRDWKKSKQIKGGFRAQNMDFLTKNFEKADIHSLSTRYERH